jgi:TPR repeat protein
MICEFGKYGVPKNQADAVKYYRMASDQGSPHGMMFFADMLEHGKGVRKDVGEAIRLYRLAIAKGHSKAFGCLGYRYVSGNGVPKDVAKGRELIQQQINLGDPVGLLHFARIAENGLSGVVDLAEAFRYYAMAAAQGVVLGVLKMARMIMLGQGTQQNPVEAFNMYKTLIERDGNTDAMVGLGVHFIQGEGVKKDVARGTDLIRKAANLGNKKAMDLIQVMKTTR